MTLNAIAKLLMLFGSILLLKSISMDTTVWTRYGYIYNVGLLHEKDNLVTLGSVFFLAGVILIATSKTNDSEKIEHKKTTNPFITIVAIEDSVKQFFKGIPKFVKSILNSPYIYTPIAGQVALLIILLILLIYALAS
jgi:hypothetical protein